MNADLRPAALRTDLDRRAEVCRAVALSAGEIARAGYARQQASGSFRMKGPQDYLTETDAAVEDHIRAALAEAFPDDGFLGEETGGTIRDATWVVDPIDGTANFARGIPHWCIAIAFAQGGQPEIGAIYNPALDELYFARRGGGTTRDGRPVRVAPTTDYASATFELGWSTRVPNDAYVEAVAGILACGGNVRRGASGALGLAYVADGRSDGYAEIHMNAWDCVAGLLMVREAGGRTGPFPGPRRGRPRPRRRARRRRWLRRRHRTRVRGMNVAARHDRPALSLIEAQVPRYGVGIYVGGMEGAGDLDLLAAHGITTVVNCAVNLDLNYATAPFPEAAEAGLYGIGAVRYYKLGLIDGPGNPETMMLAGFYLLRGAFEQQLPEKPTYPRRERGNVLVNCRGGRSRSVALVALFLHVEMPERYPTLEDALSHVRTARALHRDEWFETPKAVLVDAARRAAGWIALIDAESRPA